MNRGDRDCSCGRDRDVSSGAASGPDPLGEVRYLQDSAVVPLVRAETYVFDGRTSSSQELVIADCVDVSAYSTVYLGVVVHSISSMGFASLRVAVDNVWFDDDDPSMSFVQRDILVSPTLGSTAGNPQFTFGVLGISLAMGPLLRVRLAYLQAGFSGSRTATLSIFFVNRASDGPKV